MNLKKNHYSRRALALLLTLVMCVGMIPTAFAAQQNSYHDPAEHWMQASGRTNELDANSVVTRETFKCGECGKATSFEVFRVPEYTRNGQPALSRNVKYSDGTMVDGVGKGDTMDGIPGKDATYTGYHYTKAVCETCGGINTNMSKSEYGYLKMSTGCMTVPPHLRRNWTKPFPTSTRTLPITLSPPRAAPTAHSATVPIIRSAASWSATAW